MTPEPHSFLVAGHPRSGTTVLTRVLNTHPDIGATFELGAFLGLGAPCAEYRRGVRLGYRDRPVVGVGTGTPRTRRWASRRFILAFRYALWRRRQSRITLEVATEILSACLRRACVGDKLPAYVFALDELASLPGLRPVVIVRDCRAVTASTLQRVRTGWSGRGWTERLDTPEKAAGNWLRALESVERNAARLHVLRYEDLVDDPGARLEEVAAYLGVDPKGFNAGLIRRPEQRTAREGLEGRDLAAVEAAAGEAMRRWGYDPA
jgi:hypothetical protein